MPRTRRGRPSAGWLAVLLVATACSGTADSTTTDATEPVAKSPASSTAVSSTTSPPASTTTTAPPSTTTTTTTTTQPPRIWDGLERVNFLLLGSDAGVGRTGTRTDTIILLSVEPESGDAAMFSIPRNLTEVPLPEGMGVWGCDCFPDIITHLWANGEWYPDAFPGPQAPSVNALKAAVGLLFDLDIHYYAKVDLAGFVAMIDAIGGVTIDVPKRIVDASYPHENGGTVSIAIEEGTQHLDGHLALAYGRIRRGSGDFARMHRQRCLIGAVIDQTDLADVAAGGLELVAAAIEHIETDIPLEALADFVLLASRIDLDRLATLRITSYNYGQSGHAGYQIYDIDRIRADATALLADPTTTLETQDGASFAQTCEESFD